MRLAPEVETYRFTAGAWATQPGMKYGLFFIPFESVTLKVLVDDGETTGWEHASVSLPNRCPNWREMCCVKRLFWDADETVIQFHPKGTEYKNLHPYCLHLWRRVGVDHELPPSVLV